ncbi:MAG TPA: AgmX/PglI C-terminal domain-containing protein [Polyangia bacterium]
MTELKRNHQMEEDRGEDDRLSGRAIEVVVMFEDAVLEVSYLTAAPDFPIGSAPGACPAPGERLSDRFPLVRARNATLPIARDGRYELVFTSEMAGEVTAHGQTLTLAELAASGAALFDPALDAHAWPIAPGARARIVIGKATFVISSVTAPERQPVPLRFEWRHQASTVACAVAAAILLGLSASIPADPHALSDDDLSVKNRLPLFVDIAPLLADAPAPPALDGKKPGADRAGGRARGESGKMGKTTAPRARKLYALAGPANNHDIHFARAAAERAARDSGILGTLRETSQIGAIFSRDDSALGDAATTVMGSLVGTEVGESLGIPDGLGILGDKNGGGGTQETVGLTNLPTIGRSGLHPDGNYGRRVGLLRPDGHHPLAIGAVPGEVHVKGTIDKEIVRRVVREHLAEVRFCYERELERRADLGGRVVAQFVIGGHGQVVASTIERSTTNDPAVDGCIAQAVRRWAFPAPEGGGVVMVSYPFVLRSAGAQP